MTSSKETQMTSEVLAQSGLKPELIAKMEAVKAACAEPCSTCHVGRGRWCRDENGQNAKAIHAARPR